MDLGGVFKIIETFFRDRSEIKIVIVYGSFALGKQNSKSDIDLAVASDRPLSGDERVDVCNQLSILTKYEVDLIDLQTASGTVLKEALTKGRVIKKEDGLLYAKILKKMLFDEEDFQKLRNQMTLKRRNKVFNGE